MMGHLARGPIECQQALGSTSEPPTAPPSAPCCAPRAAVPRSLPSAPAVPCRAVLLWAARRRRAALHIDDEYVVVNKPAGLPCMRHESNGVEELAGCAARGLGLEQLEVGGVVE